MKSIIKTTALFGFMAFCTCASAVPTPTIYIEIDSNGVTEGSTIAVKIENSTPNNASAYINVYCYGTSTHPASPGADYTNVTTVYFPANTPTVTFYITASLDWSWEYTEGARVKLLTGTGYSLRSGYPISDTFSIYDNTPE